MDKKVTKLRRMCEYKKKDMVISYMVKNKLKPDRYCVENSSKNKDNELYQYFVHKLECKPTLRCAIYLQDKNINEKHTYGYDIFDVITRFEKELGIDSEYMSKTYDHVNPEELK